MDINEMNLTEIQKRLAQIRDVELRAEDANIEALEKEVADLEVRKGEIEAYQKRTKEAQALTEDKSLGKIVETKENKSMENKQIEERAKALVENGKFKMDTRALLVSGGTIALPTVVDQNIMDAYGPEVSSLVDLVNVYDATGMGTHRVPYESAGMTAYAETEGSAGTASDVTFGYVDLTPNDFDALSYVSKQIRKQSPANYENKVVRAARAALRQKASKQIVDAVVASSLATKKTVTGTTIGASFLRDLVMELGGAEGIGAGTLVLTKEDLIAFGDVRGTNELQAVYEITPDAADPNRGTIKDGGLVVPYILNKNLTPLSTATADANCMFYADLKCIELDYWGEVEVRVSEDYKFAEGLLTVRGETLLDADLVVKGGAVVLAYDKP